MALKADKSADCAGRWEGRLPTGLCFLFYFLGPRNRTLNALHGKLSFRAETWARDTHIAATRHCTSRRAREDRTRGRKARAATNTSTAPHTTAVGFFSFWHTRPGRWARGRSQTGMHLEYTPGYGETPPCRACEAAEGPSRWLPASTCSCSMRCT